MHKFPFQRLLFSIRKFQKMLETDFDRLAMHRSNIDKLTTAEDWVGLHKEHVNASGTVYQVTATLGELVHIRSRVMHSDLQLFDKRVQDTKVKAVHTVQSFLRKDLAHLLQPRRQCVANTFYFPPSLNVGGLVARRITNLPATVTSPDEVQQCIADNAAFHMVPENSQAAVSGEDLSQAAEELEKCVIRFARIVKDPEPVNKGDISSETAPEKEAESVDGGKDNTDTTTGQVRERLPQKKKGPKLGYVTLPVVGAVVGSVIAGPAGLVAGLHISGIAGAVSGGVAGLAGGTILKFTNQEASHNGDEQLEPQARPLN